MYHLSSALEQNEAACQKSGDEYLVNISRLNSIANYLHQGLDGLPPKVVKKRLAAAMYILAGAKSMMEGSNDQGVDQNKSGHTGKVAD